MADDETIVTPPDMSWVPDTFKGEDGAFDTAGFRSSYDTLAAESAAAADAKALLPADADGYEFGLSEDHAFPEGFDAALLATTDEEGNAVEFDPASMIKADDPDVQLAKELLHGIGAPAETASKLAGIFANRELRAVMAASETKTAEQAKLGPTAKARIDAVSRSLKANLPADSASAVIGSLTSAKALMGVEALLKKGIAAPAADPPGPPDHSSLTPKERIALGTSR